MMWKMAVMLVTHTQNGKIESKIGVGMPKTQCGSVSYWSEQGVERGHEVHHRLNHSLSTSTQ
jgi:hypothetical protein